MAGKSAVLEVKILTDASRAAAGIDKATSRIDRLRAGAKKMLPAATAIGAGLLFAGKKAVDAASEMEQAQGAVESVYGSSTKAVENYASTSADRLGLAASEYMNYAALVGAALQNAGFSAKQAATESDKIMTRSADLAATYGGTTAEAVEAINAAVSRGEFDPLEKYAISLNQTAIDAELAKRGQDDLTGAALKHAKAQATLDLIYQQSSKAAGQFAREQDTVAGQTQIMQANIKNAAAEIGTALLPVVAQIADKLADMAKWVAQNTTLVYAIGGALGTFSAAIFALNAALKVYTAISTAAQVITKLWNSSILILRARLLAMAAAEKIVTVATIAWNAATKAAAIAMNLLKLAFVGNPVGLFIVALIAAGAALVVLWKKSETFRNIVKGIWAAIAGAAKAAWNAIKSVISTVIGWATGFIRGFAGIAKGVWRGVGTVARGAWQGTKKVIGNVLGWAKGAMRAAGGVAKSVWRGAGNVAKAAWRGIKAVISAVLGWAMKYLRQFLALNKTVFRAAKAVATAAWRGIKIVVNATISGIKTALRGLQTAAAAVWRAIKSVATGVWNAIRSVVSSTIGRIKTILSSVRSTASRVWNSVKSAATNAFKAILKPVNAVKSAVQAVIDAVKSLIDWIGKIKIPKINLPGPLSKLMSAPAPTAAGPAPALAGYRTYAAAPTPRAAPTLTSLTRRLGTGGGLTGGGPVVINVSGTLNDVDTANAIRRVLRNDQRRRNGITIDRGREVLNR